MTMKVIHYRTMCRAAKRAAKGGKPVWLGTLRESPYCPGWRPRLVLLRVGRMRRPRTRRDCVNGARPCPFVSCRHHLALDIVRNGGLQIQFPDMDVADMPHSCSLDIADASPEGMTQAQIAALLNVVPYRISQIETDALASLERIMQDAREREDSVVDSTGGGGWADSMGYRTEEFAAGAPGMW